MGERLSVRRPMAGKGEVSALSWHRRARIVADAPSQDLEAHSLKDRHRVLLTKPRYPQDGEPLSVPGPPFRLGQPASAAHWCSRRSLPRLADLLGHASVCPLGFEIGPDELINHKEHQYDAAGEEGFADTAGEPRRAGERDQRVVPGEGDTGRLLP